MATTIDRSLFWHGAILALSIALFLAIKDLPLLGSFGFESANLYVIIFGPLIAFASAFGSSEFWLNFKKQLFLLSAQLIIFSALLWANGFSIQSCSVGRGLAPFVIVLFPPLLLHLSLGALIASLTKRPAIKIFALLMMYAMYTALVIYSWWLEPTFRIMTHASLLLSSDLLQGGELTLAHVGFRAATLLFALCIARIGVVFFPKAMSFAPHKKTPSQFVSIVFLLALASILHLQSLRAIGKDRAALKEDYSLIVEQDGLVVRANPHLTSLKEAQKILQEALLYKDRLGQKLSTLNKKPIIIWLHQNTQEKFSYTGAKNVHFALPKHREFHISGTEIPHSVLGHELAHIYVGEHTPMLLGAPGSYLVFPNLALSEGLAMMLTPELAIDAELSLIEQAQALHQAGIRTDIRKLFSPNPMQFISGQTQASYIYSGAFLEFLLSRIDSEEHQKTLLAIIKQGNLDAELLEENYVHFSQKLSEPIAEANILWARNNFTPHSILATNCNDIFLKEKQSFERYVLNDQSELAIESLIRLDEKARADLLIEASRRSEQRAKSSTTLALTNEAQNLLRSIGDPRLHELLLIKGAALIRLGHWAEARLAFSQINEKLISSAYQRHLMIMRELLNYEMEPYRSWSLALTDMTKSQPMSLALASFELGHSEKNESLASLYVNYLYTRMLMRAHNHQKALALIKELEFYAHMLPPVIARELMLMKAESLMAQKKYAEAIDIYQLILSDEPKAGNRVVLSDTIERARLKSHE